MRAIWKIIQVLFLFGLIVGGIAFVNAYQHQASVATEKAECGVVFGAAVWKDDIPSHALSDRIYAAVQLYQTNKVDCLILSGGPSTYGSHEVDVMLKGVQQYGVPIEDIILDYNGLSTQASIENLPENKDGFVMISQNFHLGRIKLLADRYGVEDVSLHAAEAIRWQRGAFDQYFWREVRLTMVTLFYFPQVTGRVDWYKVADHYGAR